MYLLVEFTVDELILVSDSDPDPVCDWWNCGIVTGGLVDWWNCDWNCDWFVTGGLVEL